MKILVTGSQGFIGKNLITTLKSKGNFEIFEYDRNSSLNDLETLVKNCNFIFHLAGVNRSNNEEDFEESNVKLTQKLLDLLIKYNNKASIMFASSIQANLNNHYGISKKKSEDLLLEYSKKYLVNVYIYRLENVFGKWSKPNYNSVVATFAHNIANNLDITINDKNQVLNLIYIDDVVNDLIKLLTNKENNINNYCHVKPVYQITVGQLAETFHIFKQSRDHLMLLNMADELTKKLYSTYLTFLKEDDFSYVLSKNTDHRGSFTELFKSHDFGQISINISKPGTLKGNHWHHSKNEKFLVVSGQGVIRFRKIGDDKIIEYYVSEDIFEVVDIPSGYVHNIENLGTKDMLTIIWANEVYDKDFPDTYLEEVEV